MAEPGEAPKTGGCLCGAVRWAYRGAETWVGYCHCRSCRLAVATPYACFVGVRSAQLEVSGEVSTYASSPGVTRWFCGACGSPLAYRHERDPDEIHLYAAALDRPELVEPQFHVHVAEKLPWVVIEDGLPQHPGSLYPA